MKFLSKRRAPEEDFGRRRPIQTRQGQGRVFSYYASRSANETNLGRTNQEEVPKRRSSAYLRFMDRLPMLGIAILVFVVVLSQLVLTTHPKLVILSSTSNSDLFLQSTSVYQNAADKLFSQSLGNQNKLTVDAGGISDKLKSMFPELSDVSVTLPIVGNQPTVYLQPSEPTFILEANNSSYVIDSTGRALAYAQNMPAQNRASLPSVVDQSGLRAQVGNQVLPSTSVSFIQTVMTQLKAQHISVSKIVLPSASFEVDIYISGKPYFVKFNMQDANGALQQAGAYVAVAQSLAGKNITPSQYIDVRIDGRAYYK
jgi:hypothetical protein